MKQAFIDFFRQTFEFVKTHWKGFVIGFLVVGFFVMAVSCQGLVNFNGSDGNNMVISDANTSITSVSNYGK